MYQGRDKNGTRLPAIFACTSSAGFKLILPLKVHCKVLEIWFGSDSDSSGAAQYFTDSLKGFATIASPEENYSLPLRCISLFNQLWDVLPKQTRIQLEFKLQYSLILLPQQRSEIVSPKNLFRKVTNILFYSNVRKQQQNEFIISECSVFHRFGYSRPTLVLSTLLSVYNTNFSQKILEIPVNTEKNNTKARKIVKFLEEVLKLFIAFANAA